MVNHIFNHQEITMKDKLFNNLNDYCSKTSKNVFDYVPLTFVLDSESDNFISDLTLFANVFEKHQEMSHCEYVETWELADLRSLLSQKYPMFSNDISGNFVPKPVSSAQKHLGQSNLWILKLTQLNRGRGIYVINSIEQLLAIINEWTEPISGKSIVKSSDCLRPLPLGKNKPLFAKVPTLKIQKPAKGEDLSPEGVKYNSSNFVIQKYIENPLLIKERKFDIRIWVLYFNKKVYIFDEGKTLPFINEIRICENLVCDILKFPRWHQ